MWEFLQQVLKDPILGIVWGLVGFLVGNRLALGRDKVREFNIAAQAFRSAFKSEAFYFAPGTKGMIFVHDIIRDSEEQHAVAYTEFLLHLPSIKRNKFTEAWARYTEYRNAYDENADHEAKRLAVFNIYHSINTLLSYARPK